MKKKVAKKKSDPVGAFQPSKGEKVDPDINMTVKEFTILGNDLNMLLDKSIFGLTLTGKYIGTCKEAKENVRFWFKRALKNKTERLLFSRFKDIQFEYSKDADLLVFKRGPSHCLVKNLTDVTLDILVADIKRLIDWNKGSFIAMTDGSPMYKSIGEREALDHLAVWLARAKDQGELDLLRLKLSSKGIWSDVASNSTIQFKTVASVMPSEALQTPVTVPKVDAVVSVKLPGVDKPVKLTVPEFHALLEMARVGVATTKREVGDWRSQVTSWNNMETAADCLDKLIDKQQLSDKVLGVVLMLS